MLNNAYYFLYTYSKFLTFMNPDHCCLQIFYIFYLLKVNAHIPHLYRILHYKLIIYRKKIDFTSTTHCNWPKLIEKQDTSPALFPSSLSSWRVFKAHFQSTVQERRNNSGFLCDEILRPSYHFLSVVLPLRDDAFRMRHISHRTPDPDWPYGSF